MLIKFEQLEVGEFYAPVFERDKFPENPEFYEQYNIGGFFKYLGGTEFMDDSGEIINEFYDPNFQEYVPTNWPNGFVK